MSSRVFKRDQIKLGIPFKIRIPVCYEEEMLEEEVSYGIREIEDTYSSVSLEHAYNNTLEKASSQAAVIINNAQSEASAIIEDALKEGHRKARKFEEEARIKGYEKGVEEVKKEYQDLLEQLKHERQCAREEYKKAIENIENDAISVILEISKKLIGEEISVRSELLLGLIRQGLEKCMYKDSVVLSVSPEDYEVVMKNKEVLYSMVPGMGELEIRNNQSLPPASCIVETPYGNVDAGMDTRFSKIEEMFKKVISN